MNAVPLLVRTATTLAAASALTSTVAVGTAVPASAAPPRTESLDVTFQSRGLTEACGVPVTQHLWGTFSVLEQQHRTFTQFRFRSTLTAGDVVVDSRAYGPTVEEHAEDGSVTVTQLGVTMRNVPGSGTVGPNAGRIVKVVDVDGEELVVAERGFEQGPEELCSVLRGETPPPGRS